MIRHFVGATIVLACLIVTLFTPIPSYAQAPASTPELDASYKMSNIIQESTLPLLDSNLVLGLGTVIRPHVTEDGRIIVLREKNIPNNAEGTGVIKQIKNIEIQRLDAGWWRQGKFTLLYVPTIEEVCEKLSRSTPPEIALAIEFQEDYTDLMKKLVTAFQKYNMSMMFAM